MLIRESITGMSSFGCGFVLFSIIFSLVRLAFLHEFYDSSGTRTSTYVLQVLSTTSKQPRLFAFPHISISIRWLAAFLNAFRRSRALVSFELCFSFGLGYTPKGFFLTLGRFSQHFARKRVR